MRTQLRRACLALAWARVRGLDTCTWEEEVAELAGVAADENRHFELEPVPKIVTNSSMISATEQAASANFRNRAKNNGLN